MASADQRQGGEIPRQRPEAVEEVVFRTEHDRGTKDHGGREGFADPRLARGLRTSVVRVRVRVRADRGHMHQMLRAGRGRGFGDRAGSGRVDGIERLPPGRIEDSDQIDHRMAALRRGRGRCGITQIGLYAMDLADAAERLQMAGQVRPADGRPDPVSGPRESPDHMTAEKSGSAEYRYQLVDVVGGHVCPLPV